MKFAFVLGVEQVASMFDDLYWPSANTASQLPGKIDPTPLIGFHEAYAGHYVLVFSTAIILMIYIEQATTPARVNFIDRVATALNDSRNHASRMTQISSRQMSIYQTRNNEFTVP